MKLFKLQDRIQALKHRTRKRFDVPRGVMLLSSGGLGDTVLFALVVSRFAALAAGDEAVTLLLRTESEKMAFLFPSSITIELIDYGRLRRDLSYRRQVHDRLFNANYRLVVNTDFLRHPHLDEAIVASCQAAESVAMEPRSWSKYNAELKANRRNYDRLYDSGPNHVDKVMRWHKFADWLTGTKGPLPDFRIPANRLPPPAPQPSPRVLIQPFSAVREKQSPLSVYRRIIAAFPAGTSVAITGAPSDLDRNSEYKELLNLPEVEFDGSTFRDLLPRLRAADLVISVDTACMHLAVIVGTPTLCIASAAYVGEIVPYAPALTPDNVQFLLQSMPCEGCLGSCLLEPERGMYPCVARLNGNTIINAATKMLGSGER